MGCSHRFSLLFQIETAGKFSLPSFPPCVQKWSSFSLFHKAPHPQSSVHAFQWKKLPPICPGIKGDPLSRAGTIARAAGEKRNLSSSRCQSIIPRCRAPGPKPGRSPPGRLFQAPRPHACGTGGRLMGQVLVPRAGSCPDKVGAEIALGQYSAVATWSCGWSHLRGSREERAQESFPQRSPAVSWGRRSCRTSPQLLALCWWTAPTPGWTPGPPPAICSPCPLPPIGFLHTARLLGQSQGFSLPHR